MKTIYFLLPILLLLTPGCDDDDLQPSNAAALARLNQEVPITTNGANRVGCLIDGEVWFDQGATIFNPDVRGNYYSGPPNEVVNVVGFDFIDRDSFISSSVSVHCNPLAEGLQPADNPFPTYRSTSSVEYHYFIDSTTLNEVDIIFLDATNRIVSGTFSMTVYNEELQDTLVITEGRFDVTYQ